MSIRVEVTSIDRREFDNKDGVEVIEVTVDMQFDVRPLTGERASPRLINQLDEQLTRIFRRVFTLEEDIDEKHDDGDDLPVPVQPQDRVGIRLDIAGDVGETFFKLVKVANDPIGQLFNMIELLITSRRILLFSAWTFQFQIVRVPAGQGGKRKMVWSDAQLPRKKSCIEIRSDDDLCIWRAIVVCRANLSMKRARAQGAIDVDVARQRYKRIARANSHDQTRLAEELRIATDTSSGSFDDVNTIANFLEINITVVNRQVSKMIQFRTAESHPHGGYEQTMYVLKRQNPDHYDAINSITGFFACSYYCDSCNTRSNGKYDHRCPGSKRCWLCDHEPEEHTEPRIPTIHCERCFRTFDDENCYGWHMDRLCKRSWR